MDAPNIKISLKALAPGNFFRHRPEAKGLQVAGSLPAQVADR
jgi:hypothetical protein